MSPVELGYSLDGVPQNKVIAKNGIQAMLETPAGMAYAKFLPNGSTWLTRSPVLDRLEVLFPGDPSYILQSTRTDGLHYNVNSIFDYLIPKERKRMKLKKIRRTKTVQTVEGEVTIEAIGYDEPSMESTF